MTAGEIRNLFAKIADDVDIEFCHDGKVLNLEGIDVIGYFHDGPEMIAQNVDLVVAYDDLIDPREVEP